MSNLLTVPVAGVSFVHFVGIIIMFHIVFLQLFPLLFGSVCSRSFWRQHVHVVCGRWDSRDLLCTPRCENWLALEGEHVIVSACWSADSDSFRVLNRDVNGEKLV